MSDPIALAVASLSLLVSATTAWLTLIRRGRVFLSRPMSIYFGPDSQHDRNRPKIYIRGLLFCDSKRGRVVESMYASLTKNESRQNFNIWVYGVHGKLVRGSGLFVNDGGASYDHHFLTPPEKRMFSFEEGEYKLEIYMKILGKSRSQRAFEVTLHIDNSLAAEMKLRNVGIYFDWGPDSGRYKPHVDEGPSPSG